MSKRNNLLLLKDILEAISRIKEYSAGFTFQTFVADQKTLMPSHGILKLLAKRPVGLMRILRVATPTFLGDI